MRLGELLVAANEVTTEQVDHGLQAQVLWGGRLGTNLVELGFIELDQLSSALGRLQGRPAALAKHFDTADHELQQSFAAHLAQRYACVPLMRAGTHRVVIASIAPLDDDALASVAADLELSAGGVVSSVAAELRIRHHLERIYDIPRDPRFLRVRGKASRVFPKFELPAAADDLDSASAPVPSREPTKPLGIENRRISAVADEAIAGAQALLDAVTARPPIRDPGGRDRRTYLPTLADAKPSDSRSRPELTPLDANVASQVGAALEEATRELRRCNDRERVARLAMKAVAVFVPTSEAAILLSVRGDVAVGWTGFSRRAATLPEIVVPLGKPGLIPAVIRDKGMARAESSALGTVDSLLLESLGIPHADLVVVPVMIADDVICTIVIATVRKAKVTGVDSIAAAAGAALTRLMRNANR